jgi:hypothetical protein
MEGFRILCLKDICVVILDKKEMGIMLMTGLTNPITIIAIVFQVSLI